jgi:hypothetical protein
MLAVARRDPVVASPASNTSTPWPPSSTSLPRASAHHVVAATAAHSSAPSPAVTGVGAGAAEQRDRDTQRDGSPVLAVAEIDPDPLHPAERAGGLHDEPAGAEVARGARAGIHPAVHALVAEVDAVAGLAHRECVQRGRVGRGVGDQAAARAHQRVAAGGVRKHGGHEHHDGEDDAPHGRKTSSQVPAASSLCKIVPSLRARSRRVASRRVEHRRLTLHARDLIETVTAVARPADRAVGLRQDQHVRRGPGEP